MKKVIGLIVAGLVIALWVASVGAQETEPPQRPDQPPAPRAPRLPHDPLENVMFPPELIMQHQRELGLTDQQKTLLRTEIGKTSARFNDLQWQLHDAMEALHETMKAQIVNEQQALLQLDKVLENEREIKRLHMELAIKIKNNLTPDQQQKLQNMRHERTPHPPGMGPGHGPGAGPGAPRRQSPGAPRPGGAPPRTPPPDF